MKNKREKIISAAIRLWRDTHDVEKVSLATIAKEAGISPTTIYNNFGTRENLIEQVIRYLIKDVMEKQMAVMQSDLPFPLKMQGLLAAKMSSLHGMQGGLLKKFSSDPVANNFLNEIYETEMKPMMISIIREGKHTGYIRKDIPEEAVMIYLDILKEGGIACADRLAPVAGDMGLMQGLTHIMYNGLFAKEFDFRPGFDIHKEGI